MVYNLKHKVVVITGATGGLGRLLADVLVVKGAKLVLIDLDEATTKEMAAAYGAEAIGVRGDVRSMSDMTAAMDAGAHAFGRLDVVIAGAGIELFYPTMELSEAAFERIIDINLTGIFRTFKAAFPYVKQTKGYLLTVSSMAAFAHLSFGSGYCASKAGCYAFTNSIRGEVDQFGVGVGSVHPTFFETPMVTGVQKREAWKILTDDSQNVLARTTSKTLVRDRIISAIENREQTVVVPWRLKGVALFAPALRRVLEWLGPNDDKRRRAYDAFMLEPKL